MTKRQKRELVLLQALVVLVSVIELLGVASIAPFMAVAANPQTIHTSDVLNKVYLMGGFTTELSFLKALGIVVLLTLLIGNILISLSSWLLTSFGVNVGRVIAANLYRNYLFKDYLYHTQNNSAVLSKNVFQEVLRVTNNIIVQSLIFNSKIFTIVFILGGLLYVNALMTITAAVILGGCYILIYIFTRKRFRENGIEISNLLAKAVQTVSEGLGGIKEVKLHGKENFHAAIFNKIMRASAPRSIYNSVAPVIPRYALEVLVFGSVVVSFIYFIEEGRNINEFLPILSIFAVAGLRLLPALQQVFTCITTIKASMSSFYLFVNDLSPLDEVENFKDSNESTSLLFANFKKLSIRDLSFKYPNSDKFAVNQLSIDIEKNTTCAFVGPSGSGKSTVVDLFAGLLTTQTGAIFIDDMALSSQNVREWQSQIGYVPQNVYLLDGSFEENIAYGVEAKAIDRQMVLNAAKLARLHDFIEQTAKGYKTRVGERGVQLSGGQRQRIGIARALYRNPAILVFDEATSALDNITEAEIMDAIENLSGQKSIILIAHRISTVRNAHKIYLMNNGSLEASGTYQQLIGQNKLFQDLART